MSDDDKAPIIIIKKVKKGGGGHHGGAWKVAYADFVTAMMAFFLLLWLLNVTTDEQKELISAYFSPSDPRVSQTISGSGGVLGGTTLSSEGALTDVNDPVVANPTPLAGPEKDEGASGEESSEMDEETLSQAMIELERLEEERFKAIEEEIRQAIESVPELKALAQNLLIDQTPEGLRIQLVDQEGKPMFQLGSARPLPDAIKLLSLITQVITGMPNRISVRGHTDSRPYGPGAEYTNWELSADRANASRRVMLKQDLDIKRIENVMGKADREHLFPKDPYSANNRRISIILLKEAIVPGLHKKKGTTKGTKKQKPQYKKREEGVIYFP